MDHKNTEDYFFHMKEITNDTWLTKKKYKKKKNNLAAILQKNI